MKKKDVEKSENDIENMIKSETQPEIVLEKMDQSFTAENADIRNVNKGSSETNQLQAGEDIEPETDRSPKPDLTFSRSTFNEVTLNIDSEHLKKAKA